MVIRDRGDTAASPAMSTMPPKAEVNLIVEMTTHDDRRSSRGTGLRRLPLCPARHPPQSVAACLSPRGPAHPLSHGHQVTRDDLRRIGPGGGRAGDGSPQGSRPARRRGVEQAHARLSGSGAAIAALGDAINAGFGYLEVKCLGCNTHQTVALDIVRRPKATPVHELERYMRCKDCSQVRGYPYKRSHLVALRATKITASDPPSTWWPGER